MLLGTVLVLVGCKGFHGAVAQSKTSLFGKALKQVPKKDTLGFIYESSSFGKVFHA